ncbi:MAG: carbohydrate ABC transporter permease [Treponema sp.]|nr:carbohydrate ABC transporter permease [Treponema sp.]
MSHDTPSALESVSRNRYALARKRAAEAVRYAAALVICLVAIFPLYWMFISSFKSQAEILLSVPTFWPREWHFENYANVFGRSKFGLYYFNTFAMTAGILAIQILTGIPAAYGFSKGQFKGKNILFMLVLGALMIPIQVTFISIYLMCARLNIVDTYWALVLPEAMSAYFIFMIRQSFMSVDDSYVDAAKIDGMGTLGIIINVMVPMCKAAITTILLVTLTSCWNSYFWPKIIIKSGNKQILTVGLAQLRNTFAGMETMNNHEIMAGAVMAVLPIVILFFIFQRYMLEGYSKAAMK